MALTNVDATSCEQESVQNDTSEARFPLAHLPKLVWVGSAMFALNVTIGIGMLITPNLEADVYGKEVHSIEMASAKPSPFTEVVDTRKHRVRLAAKARPVEFVPAPVEDVYASLDLPRASAMYQQLDVPRTTRNSQLELDIPRASRAAYQQLDMPVRTEPAVYRPNSQPARFGVGSTSAEGAVHQGMIEVTPRRASDQDKRFVVIN